MVSIRDDQGGMKKQTGEYQEKKYPLLNLNKTSIFTLDGSAPSTPSTPSAAAAPSHNYTSREDGMRFGMVFKMAGDYYLKNADAGELPHPDDFVKLVTGLAVTLHKAAKEAEKL